MRPFIMTVALLVILSFGVGLPQAASAPFKLKIGYIEGTLISSMFVGVKKGFLTTPEFEVELIPFPGGAATIQAMLAGGVHLAQSAWTPAAFLLSKNPELDLKGVLGVEASGPISYVSSGLVKEGPLQANWYMITLPQSPVKTVADLKGKRVIGGNAPGAHPTIITERMLKEHGLNHKTDMTFTTMPFSQMNAALVRGEVDAAFQIEPFYTIAKEQYGVRSIFNDLDVERLLYRGTAPPEGPIGGGSLLFAREKFLKENTATFQAFLGQYLKAADWIWENRAEARQVLAKWYGFPEDVALKATEHSGPRNGLSDLGHARREMMLLVEMGYLKGPIEGWPDRYVDYSYVKSVR